MQVAFPKFFDLADPRDCCYFCCFPKYMLCLARGRDLRSGNLSSWGTPKSQEFFPHVKLLHCRKVPEIVCLSCAQISGSKIIKDHEQPPCEAASFQASLGSYAFPLCLRTLSTPKNR